jgi:hypothetical protein
MPARTVVSMRPSAYYMRRALRSTENPEELRAIGLHCVAEYERLREWVRGHGLVPPKFEMLADEARDKGLAD